MLHYHLAALSLAASLAAANPALADTGLSQKVGYADLNLASPAGAAVLKARIASAVRSVCPDPDTHELVEVMAVDACRRHARQTAGIEVAVVLDRAQRLASRDVPVLLAAR